MSGDESARLEAVDRYRVVDSPFDALFTRMADLAASALSTPMAAVSLVDDQRNWFLGLHGLDDARDIRRDEGLCGLVIDGEIPGVCTEVLDHPGAAQSRFLRSHDARFYACAPIVDPDGHTLGAVAVMDTEPRTPDAQQLAALADVAAAVMDLLAARLATREALRMEQRLRDAAEYSSRDALRDRDLAMVARDEARRDRDLARTGREDAEADRSDARQDRDSAIRDRDVAEHDRDVIEQFASVLQKTLLPPMLPDISGVSLAAHYHPADPRQVGGDFYDLFELSGDRWGFFIGDVQGHGVEAAAATSLIRYALRSAALRHRDCTDSLAELNAVLLQELHPRRFCTVLLGTIEPDEHGFRVTIATGGHPPALMIDPQTETAHPIRSSSGMLVGAVQDASFHACSLRLLRGQTLLLYTDGIIESRVRPVFDEERLAEFVATRAHLGAKHVIAELAAHIPTLKPGDDVALVAITAD